MTKYELDNNLRYKLIKEIGVLNKNADYGVKKKVTIIKWSFNKPTIDIRRRKDNEPKKGISLTLEEAEELTHLLNDAINTMHNIDSIKNIENDFSLLDED